MLGRVPSRGMYAPYFFFGQPQPLLDGVELGPEVPLLLRFSTLDRDGWGR